MRKGQNGNELPALAGSFWGGDFSTGESGNFQPVLKRARTPVKWGPAQAVSTAQETRFVKSSVGEKPTSKVADTGNGNGFKSHPRAPRYVLYFK
jgi:hypothetical protein